MTNEFPAILAALRAERGLSQRKAAAELGISQALLSLYEKGAREPGLAFVVRACDFYAVSADYMLGRRSDGDERLRDLAGRLRELSAEADRLIAEKR